ncbi:alpha/beta hydrolase fold domain-containing protein [Spirillospora sp. CA-255316]
MPSDVPSDVLVEEGPLGLIVSPRGGAPGPVVLYVHGDRYLSGSLETGLDSAGRLAARTGDTVVCARYRAAFPAALEDVEAAYAGCGSTGPVAVAGEGIGAGLVAALLVRLRDSGAPMPRRAALVSALLDLSLQAASLQLNAAADPGFDLGELRRRVAGYAGGTALTDPLLSPLFANLHGLPPVQLLVAGTDPLLDDSLAFAARGARSGVTVDLRVRPDAASLAAVAVPAMAAFIGERCPAEPSARPA